MWYISILSFINLQTLTSFFVQEGTPPPPPGETKLANDIFSSALKLFTMALENLHLQANNFPAHVLPVNVNSDPDQIVAQKARHYISTMTKALKVQEAPAGSVINLSLDVGLLCFPILLGSSWHTVSLVTRRCAHHSGTRRSGNKLPLAKQS